MFRKIQDYSKNDVIRAKKAGLDKNGSKCVRGVSGACRGRVGGVSGACRGVSGACRGRVGGVSGACGGRVGRVSGLNFQVSSCFPTENVSFAFVCQKMRQISTFQHQNNRKLKKKHPKQTERQ